MIFRFFFAGMPEIPCTVTGTDGGKSWLVWSSCWDMGGKVTTMWSIMSRTPTMDPKLEQTLVQYIEKHAGVTGDQLHGMGQSNCYGNTVA